MLVTAKDAPTLFDLRCHVREHMVAWVRDHADGGMPRQRVEVVEPPARTAFAPVDDRRDGGLFHGDPAADERGRRAGHRRDPPPAHRAGAGPDALTPGRGLMRNG